MKPLTGDQVNALLSHLGFDPTGWPDSKKLKKLELLPKLLKKSDETDWASLEAKNNPDVHNLLLEVWEYVKKNGTAPPTEGQKAEEEAEMATKEKTEKAAKGGKEKAKGKDKSEKAKGGGAGNDKFGSRLGTNNAKFNAVLSKKAKTMAELREEAGLTSSYYEHVAKLIDAGHVVKTDDGKYKLAK